jgi:hypothetical protein
LFEEFEDKVMLVKRDIGKMIKLVYKRKDIGNIPGILLSYNRRMLAVQVINDFYPDGIEIAMIDKLKTIKKSNAERIYHKVYRNSDFFKKAYPFELPGSIQKTFEKIRSLGFWIIVEVDKCKNKRYFYIGSIKRITKKSVSIRYFSVTGKWDHGNSVIDYNKIARVQFGDKYCAQWRKYLEKSK